LETKEEESYQHLPKDTLPGWGRWLGQKSSPDVGPKLRPGICTCSWCLAPVAARGDLTQEAIQLALGLGSSAA